MISPLSVSDFVDPELTLDTAHLSMAPQLGILCLAAALIEDGVSVEIVNVDQHFFDFLKHQQKDRGPKKETPRTQKTPRNGSSASRKAKNPRAPSPDPTGPEAFFASLVRQFESLELDIFGFGSICSSFPLTLRLAKEVKRLHPNSAIILGGPQASVVDEQTIRTFPFVDYVVRGEADRTLPLLVAGISGANSTVPVADVPGVTFRREGDVVRNPSAPVIDDLDALPLPAFHLDAHIEERTAVHLEIGRGCPFTCTFCSTNDFFRRNFRLKSPQKMLEHMKYIKDLYGIRNFSLVHDMYTIDRKRVAAFCEALLDSGEDFIWSCSARTDCMDENLIELMARAGCRGIFFGIETGSARLQKVINKKLDLAEATEMIMCADEHKITTAVALITAFPDETRDDLRDTVHYFVNSLRFDTAEPQLSLLAPLAQTPLQTRFQDELVFDGIFSDMSHQGWRQDPHDAALIEAHPDIFPNFYAIPTANLEREYFRAVHDFVTAVSCWFRWLPLALLRDCGDFLNVFDRWQEWRVNRLYEEPMEKVEATPYYNRGHFAEDFHLFVRQVFVKELANSQAEIDAVNEVEKMPKFWAEHWERDVEDAPGETLERIGRDSFPYVRSNVHEIELDVDYQIVLKCLRNGSGFESVPHKRVSIVFVQKKAEVIEIRQLGALASPLLRLCDGRTTVGEVTAKISRMNTQLGEMAPEKVCSFGLNWLREQGLIRFSSTPLSGVVDVTSAGESKEAAEAVESRKQNPRAEL